MGEKLKFLLLSILFLGTVSVLAGNVFVNENGIVSKYFSSNGNAGITENVSFEGGVLVIEDGLVVGVLDLNETGADNDTNEDNETNNFPLNGLVSYYSFDVDASDDYGDNDGTVNGAELVEGKLGSAYDFENSEDDEILMGVTPEIVDHSFSVSTWIKPESHETNMRIFSQRNTDDGDPTNTFNLQTDGRIWWNMRDNNGAYLTQLRSSQVLLDGQWYHVVVTYNSSTGERRLYVDGGTPDVDFYRGGSWGSVDAQMVGSSPFGPAASFDGVIDEVGVWDRVLSGEEVLGLWNDGVGLGMENKTNINSNETNQNNETTFPEDGLISYYKLDEESGAAIDSTGFYNGTIHGLAQNQPGKINTAYSFNRTEADYIDTGLSVPTEMTVSMWIKPKEFSEGGAFFGSGYSTSYSKDGWAFDYSAAYDRLQLVYWKGNSRYGSLNTETGSVPKDQWTFVTFRTNGTGYAQAYINGEFAGDFNYGTTTTSHDRALLIGRHFEIGGGAWSFDGSVDEVGIWNRELTDQEILDLYNEGIGLSY